MATIFGTEQNDYLVGTPGDDEIFGEAGNDIIFGGAGDDVIYDGAGFDNLFGGPGDDTFKLFDNNRFGPSALFDPFGMAEISGGPGYDTIDATEAIEPINFAESNFAIASIEAFSGSELDDTLSAALVDFDVVLSGQAGNDTLTGGSGNDRISGGPGADLLTGGPGNDVFVYASLNDSLLSGFDVIQDLAIGNDFIEAPVSVAAADLSQLGAVTALESQAIAEVLTPEVFLPLGAATFTFEQQTFLALNDEVVGFQAANNAVIEISGYSGNLTDLSITSSVLDETLPSDDLVSLSMTAPVLDAALFF